MLGGHLGTPALLFGLLCTLFAAGLLFGWLAFAKPTASRDFTQNAASDTTIASDSVASEDNTLASPPEGYDSQQSAARAGQTAGVPTAVVSRDLPGTRVEGKPALAIVLDDCGFSMEFAGRLAKLQLPLTWAIIPNLRYSTATAKLLDTKGIPYIMHIPMQAYVDADGLAGTQQYSIGVGMSADAVRKALVPVLDAFPGAYGINNHRGSKATSDQSTMNAVMAVLSERRLFFMDSSTSQKSVAYKTAARYGLDTAKNNYFLDNVSDRAKVREQLDTAISGAKKKGSAVAICHMRPETIACLEALAQDYAGRQGVRFVTLPELVKLRKGD